MPPFSYSSPTSQPIILASGYSTRAEARKIGAQRMTLRIAGGATKFYTYVNDETRGQGCLLWQKLSGDNAKQHHVVAKGQSIKLEWISTTKS
ncbi:hypothetical protein CDL15_Pgr016370 [Punica granatum]|uniref:Uncharacterized protein n=1 Tax=Punica granatum TaxID=22663 RepID=A0A218W772_PUNGR|nr:hypothetical protein CDL15_Pgr016370 [Punica granatum]